MLIKTAVFPAEMLSDLAFQIGQLMKKGGQTDKLEISEVLVGK